MAKAFVIVFLLGSLFAGWLTYSVVVGNVQGVWHKPRAQECSPQAYKASDDDILIFMFCQAYRSFVIQLSRAQDQSHSEGIVYLGHPVNSFRYRTFVNKLASWVYIR